MKYTSTAGGSFVKMAGLLCLVGAVVGAIGGIVTGFERAAKEAFSSDLRQSFADARTRLAEAGLRRLL